MISHVRTFASVALGFVLAAGTVGQGHAQTGAWAAWLGCWEPVVLDPTRTVERPRGAVCFLPGEEASQVEVLSLEDGVVVEREVLDASGAEAARAREGCTGVEVGRWSADGTRLFSETRFDCPGNLRRTTSGISAINPDGEWVSVEAVEVGGGTDLRAVRYRAARELERTNREVAAAVDGLEMAIDAARRAAAAPASLDDVIEATRAAEVQAVQAWLIEQGQGFDVDADHLVELAEAGVPEPVIDLVVALSYPRVFAIDRSRRTGEVREGDNRAGGARRGGGGWMYPAYRGGFYPGYWGGGWYGPPVIIVRDPDGDVDRGGRAVSGRGYTRGGRGDSNGPSIPSTSTGPSRGSGGSSPAGGGSTGRTAQPRE